MVVEAQLMSYQRPRKFILSQEQLEAFQRSKTHDDVLLYIEVLNNEIAGAKLSDQCSESEGARAVLAILDRIEKAAESIPPVENSASRFGNPAFRTFYDKVAELSPSLHESLPGLPDGAAEELSTYLEEAWGNRSRIDYGSGMELNFLCWLLCLERLGVLDETDHKSIVLRIFWKYLQIMRHIQSTYWLEPAGSHGVWGLDDYHFLPFLWGAAQLKGHKFIRPRAIHDSEIVDELAKDYMYFSCIKFINSIKTASLRWHSPMLDDISAVKTWDKVNSGMIKMYQAEVLHKLPVIQHFYFGSLLPYDGPTVPANDVDHDDPHFGHAHGKPGEGWAQDCCGIPVPSAFGAAQADRKNRELSGPGIRPVPFD